MRRSTTAAAETAEEQVDLAKMKVRGRGLGVNKRIGLRALREACGVTQADLAERTQQDQSQVSRVEAGDDHLVSTLRRYAEGLGGELHVVVVLDGRRYRIG